MLEITKVYKMLNWKNSREVILEGMRLAEKIDDLSLLIMPPAEPSVWENTAIILSRKSDEELVEYLPKLFEWLCDTNWPGAMTIYNRLLSVPREMLMTPYNKALQESRNTHDQLWEEILIDFMKDYENKHKI